MKPVIPLNTRARQRGQALIWFLATVAASCIVLAVVYNVGQVANEKEKTVNAADASALSGALVEARILNFTAYTNRAMIANEVTIAQLVSADSFVRYDATMAQYLADYLQVLAVVPIVGDAIVTTLNSYAQLLQYVQQWTDQAVAALIPACNLTIDLLKGARQMAVLVAPIAANEVASDIAEANQTIFGGRFDERPELNSNVFSAMNANDWRQFINYNEGKARGNAERVIMNSLDPFSRDRREGPFIDTLNTALKWGMLSTTFGTYYVGFEKTSGSTQLTDFDHWVAQDSLDPVVTHVNVCWKWGVIPYPCYSSNYATGVMLAYGRAEANKDGSSVSRDLCLPKLSAPLDSTTNCGMAVRSAKVFDSNGIPNIFDLANPNTGGPDSQDPTLTFIAGVQKKADAALTTQRMGLNTVHVDGPQGSPDVHDDMQNGDRLTSIASAQVSYARPDWDLKDITRGNLPRPDRIHEYASLYNPYWQARLTPTDEIKTKPFFYALIHSDPRLSAVTP